MFSLGSVYQTFGIFWGDGYSHVGKSNMIAQNTYIDIAEDAIRLWDKVVIAI